MSMTQGNTLYLFCIFSVCMVLCKWVVCGCEFRGIHACVFNFETRCLNGTESRRFSWLANKLQWFDWLRLQPLKAGVSRVHWHVWCSMEVQRSLSSGLLSILDFFTKFGLTICLNWNHYFIKFLMQLIVIIISIIFICQMLIDYMGELFWILWVMFIAYISFYY